MEILIVLKCFERAERRRFGLAAFALTDRKLLRTMCINGKSIFLSALYTLNMYIYERVLHVAAKKQSIVYIYQSNGIMRNYHQITMGRV